MSGGASDLTLHVSGGGAYQKYLQRYLRAAHKLLGARLRELSVALVDDRKITELHARFLGIREPTDVLTFPLEVDRRGRVLAGEVVVCIPEARRRAKELRNPVRNELLLYALHGMLHLCGFDDRTAGGFARMHRMEDSLLSRLGVGPVFRPRPESAGTANRRRRARSRRLTTGVQHTR